MVYQRDFSWVSELIKWEQTWDYPSLPLIRRAPIEQTAKNQFLVILLVK